MTNCLHYSSSLQGNASASPFGQPKLDLNLFLLVPTVRTKPIQLRFIPRGSTERYAPKPPPTHIHQPQQPQSTSQTFLQPSAASHYPPRSPCSPHHSGSFILQRSNSQRRGSTPQAPPQIMYGATSSQLPHSAQSSPPGPRSPRLGYLGDPWSGANLKIRRSSGEMEWLTAPGLPRSRKNSWSSVSTDCGDFSPCW